LVDHLKKQEQRRNVKPQGYPSLILNILNFTPFDVVDRVLHQKEVVHSMFIVIEMHASTSKKYGKA
jgi:hypothetical protein